MSNLSDLAQALVDLNEDQVNFLVKQKVEAGEDPLKIIKECNDGMSEIGKLFEDNEYYLSELIMSGEILKGVMNVLEPMLGNVEVDTQSSAGVVVVGTVKDDIHDIGKNIVVTMLKGTGFEVVDLGVDVPADVFVKTVQETGAKAVGLSALLNFTFPEMKKVVDELAAAGLRDKVKVIIGGAPCNEDVRKFTGADYYAKDAAAGVKICKEIYGLN
ncbi:cobalamin B12-binding domain-containing protein [Desulfolucanica intricata]|uniref:cobalamin B12-binding domain-containing protein n=1 Tax=Desulfolucanica intricata TaxID=1285191 RepID=UPI0008359718|nr:cobalamin-dependent protein [Desulfolucanica intricata]